MSSTIKSKKMVDFLQLYDEALHTPSHLLEGVVAMIESIINSREQAFRMRQQRRRDRETANNNKLSFEDNRLQTEFDISSHDTSGYRSKYAALSAKRHESCTDSDSDSKSDSEPEYDASSQIASEDIVSNEETTNEINKNDDFRVVVNKKNKKKCKNLRLRRK
jgi:hypothetical protein